MLSWRNLFLSLLFSLAFGLSAWSLFIAYHGEKLGLQEDEGKPDAFMEDVVATMINKEGKPSLRMAASKMTHYISNDSTEITNPQLTFYRDSPVPWHLQANYARALQGLSQLLLWDKVIIDHPGDLENEKTTFSTSTLTVFPQQQIAMTQDPVTLRQPNTEVHAVGMNADLASGNVMLLSKTEGKYNASITD